eukprot:SAG11_NODE_12964_length_676_cov_3.088388_1_plen_64_part_00
MPQRKRTAAEAGLMEPTRAGGAAALIVGAKGEEVTGSSEDLLLDKLFLQLSGNDGGTVRAPLA